MVDDRVSIRAHYERFPATVKGAFVMRGADGDPHQVRIESARVAGVAGHGGRHVLLESVVLDVAPNLDLFVPFEFGTMDLVSGWYQLECDVVIDGTPAKVQPGPRFAVPWPRATVRRGGTSISQAAGEVKLGQLECVSDSIRIGFEASEAPQVKLRLDGAPHPLLDVEHDPDTGRGRIVAYPAMRTSERLEIDIKGADPVEVPLP
jgi:hypothetical protein